MTPDLKKFEEKRRQSIFETIGSTVWIGLEDLIHTMWFGKSHTKENQKGSAEQISVQLDKFENRKVRKTK